jgi:hypothetical protein
MEVADWIMETTSMNRGLEIYYRRSYNDPNRVENRARKNTYFNELQVKYGERARTITDDEIVDVVERAKHSGIGTAFGFEKMLRHSRIGPSRMTMRQLLTVCKWEDDLKQHSQR